MNLEENLKIGDRVRVKESGNIGTVVHIRAITVDISFKWGMAPYRFEQLEIVNQGVFMKITNLMRKILDKDVRTVIKAGLINSDLVLTGRGEEELMGILFLEKKAELVKIAEEIIKEESK